MNSIQSQTDYYFSCGLKKVIIAAEWSMSNCIKNKVQCPCSLVMSSTRMEFIDGFFNGIIIHRKIIYIRTNTQQYTLTKKSSCAFAHMIHLQHNVLLCSCRLLCILLFLILKSGFRRTQSSKLESAFLWM